MQEKILRFSNPLHHLHLLIHPNPSPFHPSGFIFLGRPILPFGKEGLWSSGPPSTKEYSSYRVKSPVPYYQCDKTYPTFLTLVIGNTYLPTYPNPDNHVPKSFMGPPRWMFTTPTEGGRGEEESDSGGANTDYLLQSPRLIFNQLNPWIKTNDLKSFYIVHGFWCHVRNNVTYPSLRWRLGYTTDLQLPSSLVSPLDTRCSSALTNISCTSMLSNVTNLGQLTNLFNY